MRFPIGDRMSTTKALSGIYESILSTSRRADQEIEAFALRTLSRYSNSKVCRNGHPRDSRSSKEAGASGQTCSTTRSPSRDDHSCPVRLSTRKAPTIDDDDAEVEEAEHVACFFARLTHADTTQKEQNEEPAEAGPAGQRKTIRRLEHEADEAILKKLRQCGKSLSDRTMGFDNVPLAHLPHNKAIYLR